jgi:hypothetical protein
MIMVIEIIISNVSLRILVVRVHTVKKILKKSTALINYFKDKMNNLHELVEGIILS